jgi:hypothetical protein
MKRFSAVIILSGALAVVFLAAPGTAPAAKWTNCGRYELKGDVLARNVGCAKARAVIKGFLIKAPSPGSSLVVRGFSCHGSTPGIETQVSCHRGAKRVRWRGFLR